MLFKLFIAVSCVSFWEIAPVLSQFSSTGFSARLQLGDSCSMTAETLRLELQQELYKSDIGQAKFYLKKLFELDEPVCNASKYLRCDETSNECVCGEGPPPSGSTSRKYTLEDGSCHLEKGSYCLDSGDGDLGNCKSTTSCLIAPEFQSNCTINNLIIERYDTLRELNAPEIQRLFEAGQLCTCESNVGHSGRFADPASEIHRNRFRRSSESDILAAFKDLAPNYVLNL